MSNADIREILLGLSGTCALNLPGNPAWKKSRYSNSQGNCVEVAELEGGVIALRDSKNPSGPALTFTKEEFARWIMEVKDGSLDHALEDVLETV